MHRDEALFANEAFYLAFANADFAAMDRLWADRDGVVCLHPGWPALTDRRTVMESWARILGNADQPRVSAHAVSVVSVGDDAALVVCYEVMGETVMAASNVFVSGDEGPRLVSHQAGLCADPPPLDGGAPPEFDA